MAIACGIVMGRGLGDNARAALITRGLAEMVRLALAKGGKAETLMGLSGLGDLTLTCTSLQSRNYSLGLALGEGQTLAAILAGRRSIAEGVSSAAGGDRARRAPRRRDADLRRGRCHSAPRRQHRPRHRSAAGAAFPRRDAVAPKV